MAETTKGKRKMLISTQRGGDWMDKVVGPDGMTYTNQQEFYRTQRREPPTGGGGYKKPELGERSLLGEYDYLQHREDTDVEGHRIKNYCKGGKVISTRTK